MAALRSASFVFALLFLAGCASGICRHIKSPEIAENNANAALPGAPNAPGSPEAGKSSSATHPATAPGVPPTQVKQHGPGPASTTAAETPATDDSHKTVFVYKADGSLQCGVHKPVPLSETRKLLGDIRVVSSDNRGDGMVHAQMCGAPTGMLNVFEIPLESLSEALKRGFKKLEPRS
jgi:hypothetical protein